MKYPWTDSQNDTWADSIGYSWGPTTSGTGSDENTLILPPFRTEIVFSVSEVTGSIIIELPFLSTTEYFTLKSAHIGFRYSIDSVNRFRMKKLIGIEIKNVKSYNRVSEDYITLLSRPDNDFEEGSILSFRI